MTQFKTTVAAAAQKCSRKIRQDDTARMKVQPPRRVVLQSSQLVFWLAKWSFLMRFVVLDYNKWNYCTCQSSQSDNISRARLLNVLS